MGLWFFLSDWISGAVTPGGLFKRMAINFAWTTGLLFIMIWLGASADVALIVVLAMFVVNGVTAFMYLQQRRGLS